jgi:rhodanese-related sulfurtransferase
MEFKHGHIPVAIHAPSLKILLKMANLPKDKNTELVVTCEHGPRAVMAQRLLTFYGYREGHMAAWKKSRPAFGKVGIKRARTRLT